MAGIAHETLRRKIGEARVNRPPIRDPEFVSDLFARLLEERLRGALQTTVEVNVAGADMARLSAALATEEPAALLGVAETRGGGFGAALTFAAPMIHQVIESMTGAPGAPLAGDRPPTAIDEALLESFARDVIDCFERAAVSSARPDHGVAIAFSRFARKATSLTESPDLVDTLAFRLSIRLGGAETPAGMSFIVPLGVLDMYRAAERAESARRPPLGESSAPEAIWTAAMLAAARSAEYRLVGVLSEMSLTVSEVAALQPGSVIPLPDGQELAVSFRVDTPRGVAGAPEIAAGALGVASGRRAVKVTTAPAPDFIERLRPYAAAG
ncbi:MAG: FliM/FliN family flagellar motor switch protein [Pikeienuella sp.]